MIDQRRRIVSVGIALALFAGACASVEESADLEARPDPVSTGELGGLGGGSLIPVEFADLANDSTAAIEATVVDVRRSRLNTPDGLSPKIDTSRGPDQLKGLYPMTEVELRVEAVLGDRGDLDGVMKPGELVVITLGGGETRVVYTPEESRALGIILENDDQGGPQPENQVDVYPTEPVEIVTGVAPSVYLAEGERVIMFLSRQQRQLHPASDGFMEVIGPTHPKGVFRQQEDGEWMSRLAEPGETVDVLALAASVDIE